MKGKVYLVGAGPGDPELLTVKALRVLKTADAVLHDDLVSSEILKLIPPTAQVQNVGKRCGNKNIVQEEINFLMIALADWSAPPLALHIVTPAGGPRAIRTRVLLDFLTHRFTANVAPWRQGIVRA